MLHSDSVFVLIIFHLDVYFHTCFVLTFYFKLHLMKIMYFYYSLLTTFTHLQSSLFGALKTCIFMLLLFTRVVRVTSTRSKSCVERAAFMGWTTDKQRILVGWTKGKLPFAGLRHGLDDTTNRIFFLLDGEAAASPSATRAPCAASLEG